MSIQGWIAIIIVLAAVVAAAIPLGTYIVRVMAGERTVLSPVLGPVERGFYALMGVDPHREQGWRGYTLAMLAFSAAGFFSLYALQRLQGVLPLNRKASMACPPTSPSTRRSASSPTPTGRTMVARPPWLISSRCWG